MMPVLVLLLQIGCSENTALKTVNENDSVSSVKTVESSNANVPVKPVTYNNGITKELSEDDKYVIYCALLGSGFGGEGFSASGLLVYGKTTIPPKDFDRLKKDSEISESLLLNFEKANRKIQPLRDGYDVPAAILSISGDADTLKLYEAAKRKYPDATAVVNFSNVGIDDTYSIGLVYVEFYQPDKGLDRFYYEMVMGKMAKSARAKANFYNVTSFRKIPVN